MVAVLDEVGPADLEDVDRRRVAVGERRSQTCQPASRQSALGSEVAAEVVAAVDGADDALDGNLLQAEIRPAREREPAAHLVEGDELHQPARSMETLKSSPWRSSASRSPSNWPMRTMPSKEGASSS